MFARLHEEFARYFMIDTSYSNGGSKISFSHLFSGKNRGRNIVSEIIPGRVYLSNLPDSIPFSSVIQLTDGPDAGLVMSCVEMNELARSLLISEPHAEKIKYYVLAMEDSTAKVGSDAQMYAALQLMDTFAEREKPIQIHCREGVGRSAMKTAIHIATRYLKGDPVYKNCIDQIEKLDPTHPYFIESLYRTTTKLILSKRSGCSFPVYREQIALKILTTVQAKIQLGQPIAETQDDNYQFMASFVQMPEFKKLFTITSYELKQTLAALFKQLALNQEGWYQQLLQLTSSAPANHSPLSHELLNNFVQAIKRLVIQYPQSDYAQQVVPEVEVQNKLVA